MRLSLPCTSSQPTAVVDAQHSLLEDLHTPIVRQQIHFGAGSQVARCAAGAFGSDEPPSRSSLAAAVSRHCIDSIVRGWPAAVLLCCWDDFSTDNQVGGVSGWSVSVSMLCCGSQNEGQNNTLEGRVTRVSADCRLSAALSTAAAVWRLSSIAALYHPNSCAVIQIQFYFLSGTYRMQPDTQQPTLALRSQSTLLIIAPPQAPG